MSTWSHNLVQRTFECVVVGKLVSAVQTEEMSASRKEGISHAKKRLKALGAVGKVATCVFCHCTIACRQPDPYQAETDKRESAAETGVRVGGWQGNACTRELGGLGNAVETKEGTKGLESGTGKVGETGYHWTAATYPDSAMGTIQICSQSYED